MASKKRTFEISEFDKIYHLFYLIGLKIKLFDMVLFPSLKYYIILF